MSDDIVTLQARLARVIEAYGEHSEPAITIGVQVKQAMTQQLMRETATPMNLKSEQERRTS